MNPAIVISAYNREEPLKRLLLSLQQASYPPDEMIPLVISIDNAGEFPQVLQAARDFQWPSGLKTIIPHAEQLGPIGHFYACGDLTESYGDIIFLEDDLVVSPVFYHYAEQALAFYKNDARIACLSLYSLWFNGYTQEPFVPLSDESDAFFLQVPYTQGQVFSRGQWTRFREWGDTAEVTPPDHTQLHSEWFRFRPDEWFPWLTRYLVETNAYAVFPRVSLSTGFGDPGTHFTEPTSFFQTPLQRGKTQFSFNSLVESLAVYDSFFEIEPDRLNCLAPLLSAYTYGVDLYATRTRDNIRTDYVLTSRPCRRSIASFGRTMWPMEANIAFGVPGKDIFLARADDLRWDKSAAIIIRWKNSVYFNRGRRFGFKRWLSGTAIGKWIMRIISEVVNLDK